MRQRKNTQYKQTMRLAWKRSLMIHLAELGDEKLGIFDRGVVATDYYLY
jgi:hypothetical protein